MSIIWAYTCGFMVLGKQIILLDIVDIYIFLQKILFDIVVNFIVVDIDKIISW